MAHRESTLCAKLRTTMLTTIYTDTECVKSGLKDYQRKKLFYSRYFRTLYDMKVQPEIKINQYIFKIATHCWLLRFREEDIMTVLAWWHKKHGIHMCYGYLRGIVIPKTYDFTIETVKARKKAENQRAKLRRSEKAQRKESCQQQ